MAAGGCIPGLELAAAGNNPAVDTAVVAVLVLVALVEHIPPGWLGEDQEEEGTVGACTPDTVVGVFSAAHVHHTDLPSRHSSLGFGGEPVEIQTCLSVERGRK